MSAAVAMAPSPAPHDRPSYVDRAPSASHHHRDHHPSASPPTHRMTSAAANHPAQRAASGSPKKTPSGKSSPNSARSAMAPKITIKKEAPSSPELPAPRHRPGKLDLSKNKASAAPASSRPSAGPLTSRGAETAGLMIHDVGLACLSPGFVTQDPTMREQLQRSISVREHQRHIIELRLQQTAKPGDAPMESAKEREAGASGFPAKTPGHAKRKAPPGLSIVAPSHEQFANERVIQSAPLDQSFTGRHQHPHTRHVQNQPSNLSNTSHIHHVPATQTTNRLPPITDVFAAEGLGAHREAQTSRAAFFPGNPGSASNSSHSSSRPSFPSPGHNHSQPPPTARPREYRSAEDAQVELAGGRPELLPKLVHYGGHQQPPTPPSPLTGNLLRHNETSRSGGGRRRTRAEYEQGGSPPLGTGPSTSKRGGPFGEGRDSPATQQRKKEEFIRLCDRAWDLFHS